MSNVIPLPTAYLPPRDRDDRGLSIILKALVLRMGGSIVLTGEEFRTAQTATLDVEYRDGAVKYIVERR